MTAPCRPSRQPPRIISTLEGLADNLDQSSSWLAVRVAKWVAPYFLLLLWVLVFQGPLSGHINGDDGTYAVMGREVVRGHLPYVTMWDNKPPGTYFAFALAECIFGPSLIGIRILYAAAIFGTSIGLFLIGRDGLKSHAAGIGAAIAYPAFTGNNDNTEIFVLLSLSFGFWQLTKSLRSGAPRLLPIMGAGLLLGLALQFKYTAILETGFGFAGAAWTMCRLPRLPLARVAVLSAVLGFTILTPTLMAVATYASAGRLDDFLFANFVAPFSYVVRAARLTPWRSILHSAYPLLPIGLLGPVAIFALLVRRPVVPGLWILAGWMVGAALSVHASGRYFQHYFILIVPPCALAIMLFLDSGGWRTRRVAWSIAVLLLGPPVLHYVQEARWIARAATTPADYQALSAEIRGGTQPGETLYVVNDNPMLYVLSGAAIPTRFAWPGHILRDDLGIAVDADREIAAIFARRPRFIVLRETGGAYPSPESDRRLELVRLAMTERYYPVDARGGLTLFARE